MPNRCLRSGILLALLLLLPVGVRAQPLPETGPPAAGSGTPPGSGTAPGSGAMSPKEQEVLERIRQLKTPRWRSFGPCRYDWGAWRLSEGGVRFTAVECGDPPLKGSVAVHCDTLRINRRSAEGAWESWRLPQTAEESRLNGGEDLMVASLCANVRPSPPSARTAPSSAPPSLAKPPPPATPRPKPAR